jgi:hypothetical protein
MLPSFWLPVPTDSNREAAEEEGAAGSAPGAIVPAKRASAPKRSQKLTCSACQRCNKDRLGSGAQGRFG